MWKRFTRNVCDHRAAHFMHPCRVRSITLRCPMSSHSSQRGARISLRPSDSKVHVITSNAVGGRVNGCNPFGGQFGSLKKLGLAGGSVVRASDHKLKGHWLRQPIDGALSH